MILKPLQLGDLTISCPLALGPMAGVSDYPYRKICASYGAGLLWTEMVSAKALSFHNSKTPILMRIDDSVRPTALQIFGSEPLLMGEVAAELEAGIPYDFLDINMGCPVPKVVKNGEGSALLMDREKAASIVRSIRSRTSRPLSVKIRIGFTAEDRLGFDLARSLEEAGASLLTVHGRTRNQYYSGEADWDEIARIKEALSIPVIANGDVRDAASALRILEHTKADGLMIARAAEGNPFIFRSVRAALEGKPLPPPPDREEIISCMAKHAGLILEHYGERVGRLEMRKHAAWYIQGFPHASHLRRKASLIQNAEEWDAFLEELRALPEE